MQSKKPVKITGNMSQETKYHFIFWKSIYKNTVLNLKSLFEKIFILKW